jgi:long-chain acyl-CoA synthetase
VSQLWQRLPALKHAVAFDEIGGQEVALGWKVLAWSAAVRDDAPGNLLPEYERVARSHQPDDVATLIYTSGTTGVPKGVLLTQRNFASNVLGLAELHHKGSVHQALSMLPLCHIYERTNAYVYFYEGVSIAYAEGFDKVVSNLGEIRPFSMTAVPRFFEKLYAGIQGRVAAKPAPLRRVFEWAVGVGRQATPFGWRSGRCRSDCGCATGWRTCSSIATCGPGWAGACATSSPVGRRSRSESMSTCTPSDSTSTKATG